MPRYLIDTVEALLAPGLATAGACLLIRRRAPSCHPRALAWAALAGVIAALALAILRHETKLVNREMVSMATLPALACAGALLALFAFRKSALASSAAGAAFIGLLLFARLPDAFLMPTGFLSSGQSVFSTEFLFDAIGYAAGIGLVCLASFALYAVGIRLAGTAPRPPGSLGASSCQSDGTEGGGAAMRARPAIPGTSLPAAAAVLASALHAAVFLAQILLARRIIPMTDWGFAILMPLINHGAWFVYAALIATLPLPLALWAWGRRPAGAEGDFGNPAERRKAKAHRRSGRRRAALAVCAFAAAALCLTALKAASAREVVLSPAEGMSIVGGEILIPADSVSDGHLHRFAYTATDGTEVRFIVIKKNESSYGVGLDACDICGATGYYERGTDVVCMLCDVVMNKSTIGFKGGCNPVPLAFSMAGGNMVILTDDLESERKRFV